MFKSCALVKEASEIVVREVLLLILKPFASTISPVIAGISVFLIIKFLTLAPIGVGSEVWSLPNSK